MSPKSAYLKCRPLMVWGALLGSVGLAALPVRAQGDWTVVDLNVEQPFDMRLMQREPGRAIATFWGQGNTILTVVLSADGSYVSRLIAPDDPSGAVFIRGLQPDGTLTGWEYHCNGDDSASSLLWVDPAGTKTRTLCAQIQSAIGSFDDETIVATDRNGTDPFVLATPDGGRVDVNIPEEWTQFMNYEATSAGGATGWLAGTAAKVIGQGTIVEIAWVWDRSTGQFVQIDEEPFGAPSGTRVRSGPISDSSMAVGNLMPDRDDPQTWRVWMWWDENGDLSIDPAEVTDDLLGDQRPPNSAMLPLDINSRGDMLFVDGAAQDDPMYLWASGTLVPLGSLLPDGSELVILDPNITGRNALLTNESWILCRAWNQTSGEIRAIVLIPPGPDVDTDGDGLLDDWEENGIPYTGVDGAAKRYLLPGADKNHKTLYVEIDTMPENPFSPASKRLVERAFAEAPVTNPDGTTGIDLFILVDDSDVPTEAISQTPNATFPASTSLNKALYFGTIEERADPDRIPMLEAKAKAFRYALGYRRASEELGGLGELGGDDLVIFSEGYSDLDEAAVFMHELGHNLNLDHGGRDGINRKPNYPSVMNYALNYRMNWNRKFWRLDYSREELSVLNEAALDETVSVGFGGTGFYRKWRTPWYGTPPFDSPCYEDGGIPATFYAPLSITGRTDFDLDCDTNDFNVTVDLNHDPLDVNSQPSPGEIMHGTDDWSFMTLAMSETGGAFGGAVPRNELTTADLDHINATFPDPEGICGADWNNDNTVNTLDVLGFLNDWVAAEYWADLNLDGQVNTLDVLAFLNEWAGGC